MNCAPRSRAIDSVRSVDPESSTNTSRAQPITDDSAAGKFASSFFVGIRIAIGAVTSGR